jgi:hypothetical protein
MANIGFEGQCQVSEQVRQWLRPNAPVILLADRFHPSRELLGWLDEQG